MPQLLPLPISTLSLPIAALAAPPVSCPDWLRDCLAESQAMFLEADAAALRWSKFANLAEIRRHDRDAVHELLIDAWQDTFCLALRSLRGQSFGE